jgi:uncharacterized ferredoxin-like protein
MKKPKLPRPEEEALRQVAELMCLAARTAPKGRGIDTILTAILEGREKQQLEGEMRRIAKEQGIFMFERDAACIQDSPLVVLVGTKIEPREVPYCGLCGVKNCAENRKSTHRCAFCVGDLGIAIGSAVSVASIHHADNRIMFTGGKAALNLKLLGEDVEIVYAIPVSALGKSPYYDRAAQPTPSPQGPSPKPSRR